MPVQTRHGLRHSESELMAHVVRKAQHMSPRRRPRCMVVEQLFDVTAEEAKDICKQYNCDPYEMMP